jgi:hypothetical protein
LKFQRKERLGNEQALKLPPVASEPLSRHGWVLNRSSSTVEAV